MFVNVDFEKFMKEAKREERKEKIKLAVKIGIYIVLIVLLASTWKSSSKNWNKGFCPECNIGYELRGVSRGVKYYQCPSCRAEAWKR